MLENGQDMGMVVGDCREERDEKTRRHDVFGAMVAAMTEVGERWPYTEQGAWMLGYEAGWRAAWQRVMDDAAAEAVQRSHQDSECDDLASCPEVQLARRVESLYQDFRSLVDDCACLRGEAHTSVAVMAGNGEKRKQTG
jgi:hypothetical protein